MKTLNGVLFVLCVAASAAWGAEPSKYLLADPAAPQRIDYLVIAGDRFANGLAALADHRAKQGYAVGIVTMSSINAKFRSIPEFLKHAVTAWKKPAPTYLLLVGDVDAVPATVKPGALKGWLSDADLATDFDYARPLGGRISFHVGRFPCDTLDELAVMVRKTIAYETALPAGAWQHRLGFVASVGGYSKQIDALLETIGMMVGTGSVPPAFDIAAAYGSPNSPYCPYPPKFNAAALDLFNRGSLLYLFAGHGSVRGVADIEWKGELYPIFSEDDARHLNVKDGLPIFVVIACSTGQYDDDDCLGETYMKAEKGPVAFIGGSRVTQPYGNGLFAKAFVDALFLPSRTLGEALTRAKVDVLTNNLSMFRLQADALGSMMQGKDLLAPMRSDVVRHYNLFGDPALVIRHPKRNIKVTARGAVAEIEAPGHKKVELTLECERSVLLHPVPEIGEDDPKAEAKMTERYRGALDKVIERRTVQLKDGKGAVEFKRPTAPGRYFLKASDGSSVGSAMIEVQPPETTPAKSSSAPARKASK